ncbi:MAG: hypothetical protein ACE5NC_10705, partial [Anaerolineae bacterium]
MNDRTDTVGGGGSGFSSDLEKKQSRVWRVLTPVLLSLQLLLVYTGVELGLARQDSRWLPAVRAETLADYTGLWPDQPEREPLSPEIIGEIIADEMETDAAEETASQEEREAAAESLLDATPVPVTPTPTPSPTPTPGASVTAGSSPSATPTPSRTPAPTASGTPRPSATVISTPTGSPTPTATRTPTPSPTFTITATWTPTLPSDCISGGGSQVTGKEVRWDLTNRCVSDLSVTQIYIDWPASNQRLDEIKLGGSTIWDQQDSTPPTTISSGWKQEPVIEAGDDETLKFRFKKSAAAGPYQIKLTFSNGETAYLSIADPSSTLTPTPTTTPVATASAESSPT